MFEMETAIKILPYTVPSERLLGYQRLKDNAPDEIKKEAKEAETMHFKKTGRHLFDIDY